MLHNVQQYQRHTCIIVDSVTTAKDETKEPIKAKKPKNLSLKNIVFEDGKVNEDVDKCQLLGVDKCQLLGKAKVGKQIQSYKIKISLISSFCLCKQKQNTQQEETKREIITNKRKIIKYTHKIIEAEQEVMFGYAYVIVMLKFVYMNTEKVNIRFHLPALIDYKTVSENSAGTYLYI